MPIISSSLDPCELTIQGAGEAIRGNLNSFADNATFTDDSRSKVVADRGMREMRSGVYEGTGAGVTPNDTAQERVNRQEQGEGAMSGRTATGTATGPTTTGTSHQAV
jgi:hypothetical protein